MISTIVGRTGVLCSLRVPVRVRALLSYRLSILWKAFPRSVICVLSSFLLYSYFTCAPNVMVIYVTFYLFYFTQMIQLFILFGYLLPLVFFLFFIALNCFIRY